MSHQRAINHLVQILFRIIFEREKKKKLFFSRENKEELEHNFQHRYATR